jgi:histone H3/H4
MGRNYVSFHLMPVYVCQELLRGFSAQHKMRVQGKAFLNCTSVAEEFIVELEKFTAASAAAFNSAKSLRQMNNG